MKKFGVSASLAVLIASIGAIPAFAAETDEISSVLLEEALSLYGAEVGDGDLTAELEGDLALAVDGGVLDEDIVASTSELIDAGGETDSIADDLLANQQEQEAVWEEEAEVMRAAFANVAQLFDECRVEAGSCELEYSNQFRAAWVDSETARLVQLEAQVDTLTGEAKVRAEERLAARVEKLEAVVAGESPNTTRGNSSAAPGQVRKNSETSAKDDQSSSSIDSPSEPEPAAPAEPTPAPKDSSPGNSGSAPGQESKGESSPGKSESKGNTSNAGKGNGKSGE